MTRSLPLRVVTVVAGLAFGGTAGLSGVETHPASKHGLHSGDIIRMEWGARVAQERGPEPHHPSHGSSESCTCVGVCQSGGAPSFVGPAVVEASHRDVHAVRISEPPTASVYESPTAYLIPLPNAPPLQM